MALIILIIIIFIIIKMYLLTNVITMLITFSMFRIYKGACVFKYHVARLMNTLMKMARSTSGTDRYHLEYFRINPHIFFNPF